MRHRTHSFRRLWPKRIALAIAVPVFGLALLEGLLRWTEYGQDQRFLNRASIAGIEHYTDNPSFGHRFFPQPMARSASSFAVRADKPPGTKRIVILGASAAQGDPMPSFAFSRVLNAMLRDAYPDHDIEVINTSITAINSHVVLPIARESMNLAPDLYIVYLGNNEVVGPYGPGTMFASFSKHLSLIRAHVFLRSTKVSQLLMNTFRKQSRANEIPRGWGGLAMFMRHQLSHADPRMQHVYKHFESNLEAICRLAERRDVPLLLCTVPSNEKHCPPFASIESGPLDSAQLQEFNQLMTKGDALASASSYQHALSFYEKAYELHKEHAGLRFRLANCFSHLGRAEEAREQYVMARELDTLRFRADSSINNIIREVGLTWKDRGIHVADAAAAMREVAPNYTTGREHFLEHVHLTFHGNYVFARSLWKDIQRTLNLGVTSEESPLTERECAARLGYTDWHTRRLYAAILERIEAPPFAERYGNASEIEFIRHVLQSYPLADVATNALDQCYHAVAQNPDDPLLRKERADVLLDTALDPVEAENDYRTVIEMLPTEHASMNGLALALLAQGKTEEAFETLTTALAIHPYGTALHYNLARILKDQGDNDGALEHLQLCVSLAPHDVSSHRLLAQIYEARGDYDAAIEHFRSTDTPAKDVAQLYNRQGVQHAQRGTLDQALTLLQNASALYPDAGDIHGNLGNVYGMQGNVDQALLHYEHALRLDPGMIEAHLRVAQIHLSRHRYEKAIHHCDQILLMRHHHPAATEMRDYAKRVLEAREDLPPLD